MDRWRSLLLISLLCLLIVHVFHAQAEMYRYRTPEGRIVYSNMPPPANARSAEQLPEHDGGQTSSPALRATPAIPSPTPASGPPAPRRGHEAPRTARPERRAPITPIDTRQLGLIRPGMLMAEVEARLGAPSRIDPLGAVYQSYGRRSRRMTVAIARERWVYPGNSVVAAAFIEFGNGAVTRTGRVR